MEIKVKKYVDSLGHNWLVRDIEAGELEKWSKTHHITDWIESHAVKIGICENSQEYWLSRFWKRDIENICA